MLKTAILFLLTLSACNHKSDSKDIGIPGDIPFDEKSLPPMSDAQFSQAKTIAKVLGETTASRGQLLIKKDQTSGDQQKRTRRFNQLRPEIQQLVQAWRPDCPSNHVKNGRGVEGQPKTGEVYRSIETNELTGNRCPLSATERIDSTIEIVRYKAEPLSFAMDIRASGIAAGTYRDPSQAREVGAFNYGLSFTVNGRFEREGEIGSSYTRIDGSGDVAAIDFGKVHVDMSGQDLERGETKKKLNTNRVTVNSEVYVFTQYLDQGGKISPQSRYFIGNRELSQTEAEALGEFPFDFE